MRRMRSLRLSILVGFLVTILSTAAHAAALTVNIDLSDQEMTVSTFGRTRYEWPVSTARPGYRTPTGVFHPYRLERIWYSTIYDYAPMPFSIFFYGGYAIHGTTDISRLGQPASHGCVRLHPDNAEILFNLVRQHGMAETDIVIRP
jgi:lipoprotein-anchoring transpeptidase ErfK/SrfK